MEVFLSDSLDREAALSLAAEVSSLEGVARVDHISKQQALKEFGRDFGPELLGAVEGNPLPASLRVVLGEPYRSAERARQVAQKIGKMPGVEDIVYGETWVRKLDRIVAAAYVVDISLGAVITSATLFVIANTVRLTIVARRREIELMRLVGAVNAYIYWPFILEGGIQGLVGGGLAAAILGTGFLFLKPLTWGVLSLPVAVPWAIVLLGTLLGALASRISVGRFLKF